jgi:hypothetical protein
MLVGFTYLSVYQRSLLFLLPVKTLERAASTNIISMTHRLPFSILTNDALVF